MKALSLIRLGRQDESTVILQEVHGQHPSDDPTLQAMAMSYRDLYRCNYHHCQIAKYYIPVPNQMPIPRTVFFTNQNIVHVVWFTLFLLGPLLLRSLLFTSPSISVDMHF